MQIHALCTKSETKWNEAGRIWMLQRHNGRIDPRMNSTLRTSVAFGDRRSVLAISAAVVTSAAVSSSGLEVRIWALAASVCRSAELLSWKSTNSFFNSFVSFNLSPVCFTFCADDTFYNTRGDLRSSASVFTVLKGVKMSVLTFFWMSLRVRSHWRTCSLSKLGSPVWFEHLVEAFDKPARQVDGGWEIPIHQ